MWKRHTGTPRILYLTPEVSQGGPGLFFKTLYYKVRQFTTKCDQQLLHVVTALLLKIAKWFVINCDR